MVTDTLTPLILFAFEAYIKVFMLAIIFFVPPLFLLLLYLKINERGGAAASMGD